MSFRDRLPQLAGDTFITDGGIETTLIFDHGLELPCFASFPLLDDDAGVQVLRSYFAPYVEIAREHGVGLIVDSATWRASADWGAKLGYSREALVDVNRRAVALCEEIRADAPAAQAMLVEGAQHALDHRLPGQPQERAELRQANRGLGREFRKTT